MERVFVIDDDAGLRGALERLFRSAGREVEAFASPRQFLARLPYAGAGCLVLDIRMPDMSGPQLHEALRAQGSTLPIVFLTGHGDLPTGVQAMKNGALDFLLKPVDDAVLLAAVNAALERHAADNALQARRRQILERLARLSAREREVLSHILRGRMNKQIGAELGISEKTVKVHRARAMAAMQCRSVAELVHACQLAGVDAT